VAGDLMLRAVDSVLEVVAWSLVVFFVIMLFVGPQVIAEDRPDAEDAAAVAEARKDKQAPQAAPAAPTADGEAVFADTCGGCHTLSAAGTSGTTGPNLDDVSVDAAAVEEIVRGGRGSMPSFDGELSDDEIAAVAAFVAGD
jgi:sulfite dehydrogenase